jgi:aspartyl protease
VAGVHLPKQQVALAQRGAWRGDDLSSGILGLGLPALTAALDRSSRSVPYDGFVTTMVKEGVTPMFALALSRDKSESFLSLGGVPDIPTGDYATTPILKVNLPFSTIHKAPVGREAFEQSNQNTRN